MSKRSWTLRVLLLGAALLVAAAVGACLVFVPALGQLPEGARLAAVQASPHYRDGQFVNLVQANTLSNDTNMLTAWTRRVKKVRPEPPGPVPTVKTDFKAVPRDHDIVVWLGHSSFYVQLAGKRVLIDPVFSTYASPVPGVVKAFDGSSIYTADDFPPLDYVLISHDHYDHLDRATMLALLPKTRYVIAGLGMGAHFEYWGFPKEKIREGDWYTQFRLDPEITVHLLPAQHYSGRTLTRNQTLWAGYALESAQRRLFFSGDSGFGPHFEEIGKRFDGFDLVALDSGQYDTRWAPIHMNPEEAARAAEVLRAKALLPGHIGRFSLAPHPWDEPLERIVVASEGKAYRLVTPRIGEPVDLTNAQQQFTRWWVDPRPPA